MRNVTLTLTLAVLLVAAPALAGCLTPDGEDDVTTQSTGDDAPDHPLANLGCLGPNGTRCNLEASTTMGPGNEVTIAVNPTNPENVVAGAKDYTPVSAGDCVWDGVYVSEDGGETWTNLPVPGSPWLLLNDPASYEASKASQFWCTTDPVVAFGPEGTCYFSFMAYQADPVTGSKLGRGIVPMGGLNDWAFNRAAQMVAVSTDGCLSFDGMSMIADGTFPVNFHDKQWITVDQTTGRVHVAWLDFFAPGNVHYYSDDEGASWHGPQVLSTWGGTFTGGSTGPFGPAGQGTMVATGPDRSYVSWGGPDGIFLRGSTDGGATWEEGRTVIETEDAGMEASYRSGGMPFIAVDDTEGALSGSVYYAWQDTRNPGEERDILFAASRDGGETWSTPLQLNDDDACGFLPVTDCEAGVEAEGHDQFFPAVSVNPNGVVDVVWYDRRDDPGNRLLDVYHTYSRDGGETWSPNLRVTTVSSDPTLSRHQNGMVFIGDYIDIDSTVDRAYPVWADTRHGEADTFTARVERPGTLAVGGSSS